MKQNIKFIFCFFCFLLLVLFNFNTVSAESPKCPDCGTQLDDPIEGVDSTCTEDGFGYFYCPVCDEDKEIILEAKGHKFVVFEKKEPTCTREGYIKYVCSRVNLEQVFKDLEVVLEEVKCTATKTTKLKALGHDYVETVLQQVDCEHEGIIEYKCSRCDDSYQETIPAYGHDFGEFAVTKEPSCTENGLKEALCKTCGNVISEEIPATGHKYGSWIVEKEATQFSAGNKYRVCEYCNDRVDEKIDKLPVKAATVAAAVTATAAAAGSGAAVVLKKKKRLNISLKEPATKSITTYTFDDELPKFMKTKTYLKVTEKPMEELQKLYDAPIEKSTNLIVIDVKDNEQMDKAIDYVSRIDKEHHKNIALVVNKDIIDEYNDSLSDLKKNDKLTAYVDQSAHNEIKTLNMIAPLYKFDIKSDSDLGKIGKLADFLQIPYVSDTINAYTTAKKYKKHLEVKDKGFLDYSNIVGDLASIFGIQEVKEVTGFISTCNSLKSNIKKEAGANEVKGAYNAASSIINTVKDVIEDKE